jgi:HK97 family phage major capsid protein
LEKRLIDGEQKLEAMNEQIRLAQVNSGLVAATEKSSDPFKGFIFKDIDAVRHELLHGESRAVNLTSIGSAGKMTDETASAFLDYVVGDQPTLSVIETKMMNSHTSRLDRIGVGSRQLRSGVENTAVVDTNSISFGARSLEVTEAVWAEDISLSFLEDNIAGQNAESQIATVVAKAIGEELNDLAWSGDGTASPWLGINKGFEQLFVDDSDTDVTDVTMATITTAIPVLNKLYKAMPAQYRTISDQRIFCSPQVATAYMGELGGRSTMLGDQTLVGGSAGLAYFGIPITVDRHIPTDNIYMTPASNLVFGIHRDVTQELDWNPRSRQVEMTVSIRFDYQYKFGGVVARGHTLDVIFD